jgi:hypothetical protein
MTQCVTCNKSFLFAPRLKRKNENPFIVRKFINVLEMRDTNSFLYEIEVPTTLQYNLN